MVLYSKCDGRGLGEFLDVFRLRFFSGGLGTVLLLDRAQGRLQHHAVGVRGHPHCTFEPLVLLVPFAFGGVHKRVGRLYILRRCSEPIGGDSNGVWLRTVQLGLPWMDCSADFHCHRHLAEQALLISETLLKSGGSFDNGL